MDPESETDNGSEIEEESSSSGSDAESDEDGMEAYDLLLNLLLRNKRPHHVIIQKRGLYLAILENVDDFCEALACVESTFYVDLGFCGEPDGGEEKLDITPDNAAAWNKFFNAMGALAARALEASKLAVPTLRLGGGCLSVKVMAGFLRALPAVEGKLELCINVPWHGPSGSDVRALLEVISAYQCKRLEIVLDARIDGTLGSQELRSVDYTGMLANLLAMDRLNIFSLQHIDLSSDECRALATSLSSHSCSIDVLDIKDCRFLDGGGQLVACAFKTNTSLETLLIQNTALEDETSCDALLSSLPLNTSIRRLVVHFPNEIAEGKFLQNIAMHNKTVEALKLLDSKVKPDQELESIVSQSYTLERLCMTGGKQFETITRLNKAGRRYLREDATSKSKCIEVLGKVKDDLSCLFYHLRENPILFTINDGGREMGKGKKRKADEALDTDD